ncbi:hypothetical protein JCM8097_004300 [Rhodosporidiobolus ruineniae]
MSTEPFPESGPKTDASFGGSSASTDAASTAHPGAATKQMRRQSATSFLDSNIDTTKTLWHLLYYCFLTGFTSAPTFLACYLWCGFQTGGLVQLSLAVARLFSTGDHTFHKPDQQALTSLLAFLLGTSLGRYGDKVGPKKRWWIMLATFTQALLCMAAALCAHYCGEESVAEFRTEGSWHSATGMAALGFASAALGLQGIVGKRIASNIGTTLVLTTVWVEFVNDPKFFVLKAVRSRDDRALSVLATFLGGMCSAGIVFASSSAVAFAVVTGLRVICVFAWLFVPSEKPKDDTKA